MGQTVAPGLGFDEVLPVCWSTEPLPVSIDPVVQLSAMAMLEAQSAGDDEASERSQLHALEAKVDLCLLLLAQQSAQGFPARVERHVQVRGREVVWTQSEAVQSGSGWIGVVLSTRLPLPLVLPAELQVTPTGSGWLCVAKLVLSDDVLAEWWERTVFRHHRRQISRSRKARH